MPDIAPITLTRPTDGDVQTASTWGEFYQLIWEGYVPEGISATSLPRNKIRAFLSDLDALKATLEEEIAAGGGGGGGGLTSVSAADITDSTPLGRALIKATDSAAAITALSLGSIAAHSVTEFQNADGDLTAIAGLASAANKMLYATGSEAWALTTLTSFARTLLDDADAATMQATLGLPALLRTAPAIIDYGSGSVPLRSTVTTDSARKAFWFGTTMPPTTTGYALTGDVYFSTS